MDRHFTKVHPGISTTTPLKVRATPAKPPIIPQVAYRTGRTSRDTKEGPASTAPANARSRALAAGKGYSGPAPENKDDELNERTNYWEERRLDGSRDYWQVRESGRFGSHPSYDDCDDESAP